MSQIIEDLGLDLPPVTLWRVSVDRYVAECMCGYRSRPALLISNAVGETFEHGRRSHFRLTAAQTLELALTSKRKVA